MNDVAKILNAPKLLSRASVMLEKASKSFLLYRKITNFTKGDKTQTLSSLLTTTKSLLEKLDSDLRTIPLNDSMRIALMSEYCVPIINIIEETLQLHITDPDDILKLEADIENIKLIFR